MYATQNYDSARVFRTQTPNWRKDELLLPAVVKAQSSFIAGTSLQKIFTGLITEITRLSKFSHGIIGQYLPGTKQPGRLFAVLAEVNIPRQGYRISGAELSAMTHDFSSQVADLRASGAPVLIQEPDGFSSKWQCPGCHRSNPAAIAVPLHHDSILVGMIGLAHTDHPRVDYVVRELQVIAEACAALIAAHNRQERCRWQEHLLSAQSARLRALFETAPDGIIITDCNGVIEMVNPAVELLFGYESRELIGKDLTVLMLPADRARYAGRISTFLEPRKNRQSGANREIMAVRKNGSVFPIKMALSEAVYNGCHVFTGIVHDMSDHKLLENELIASRKQAEEMHRLKSSFLTNMSHELRTPLTGILGFAEMLANSSSSENRELALFIEQSGKRLLQTLNEVLDLSMLEAGLIKIDRQDCNLCEVIRERAELFRHAARERGVRLRLELAPAPVYAAVDSVFLDRIASNLIDNAIKFTHRGQVTIRVFSKENNAVFSVKDSGVGIDRKFLPHVFDAFRQESSGIDREFEGTGIGLTVTRQLVLLMKGSISVESTKGRGTKFTIMWPQTRIGN